MSEDATTTTTDGTTDPAASDGRQDGQTQSNDKDQNTVQQGAAEPWRYPDDYPVEYLRGKTADEAADLTQQMYDLAVQNNTNAQQQPQNNVPTQTQPTQQQVNIDPYSDNFGEQLQQYTQQQIQQAVQSASGQFAGPLASMARDSSRRNPDLEDVWRKYGPEIDGEMAKLPAAQKTSVDAWNMAAELVAGRHRKELAQELAQTMARAGDTGTVGTSLEQPGSTSAGRSLDPIDKLFDENHASIQKFKDAGIPKTKVKEQARRMGHTLEAYAELLRNARTLRYTERGQTS